MVIVVIGRCFQLRAYYWDIPKSVQVRDVIIAFPSIGHWVDFDQIGIVIFNLKSMYVQVQAKFKNALLRIAADLGIVRLKT